MAGVRKRREGDFGSVVSRPNSLPLPFRTPAILYIYTYLFQIILRNYWIRLSYDLKKLSRSWRVSSAEADNAEICIIVQILPCTIFVRKQNPSFIESNGRTPTRYNVLNYYSFKIFLCFVLAQIPWLINKSTTIFHGLHSYRPWK